MVKKEAQNPFYNQLIQLIESTEKKMMSTTHKYEPLKEDAMNYVEGAFYSNMIRLFRKNMNEEFFQTVNMSSRDKLYLESILKPYFDRANQTFEEVYNKGEVDFFLYMDFRRTIYEFGDDAYWLLLGVEKYAEIIKCEHRIIQFKNEVMAM